MIQKGQPAMFGVTFDAALLSVAARVFNSAGSPVGPWTAMLNYDGFSYQLPITFASAGAYSVKKVVFTDGTFTTRAAYPEADDAVQVVDLAGGSSGGGGSAMQVKMRTNKLKVTMESEDMKL